MDAPDDLKDLAEPNPRVEGINDQITWTLDRRLQAMAINAINLNTAATGNWGKDGPPEFPTVGPADWQDASKGGPAEPVYKDNFDFFRKIGAPVG